MTDIKYKNSTGILILNELGEILLLKRKSNGLWTAPGGKIGEGEDSLECAIRELKEETGIENIELELYTYATSLTNQIHWKETHYIGYINSNIEVKNVEKDIFYEIRFFDLNELPDFKEIEGYDHDLIRMLRGEMERNMEKPHPGIPSPSQEKEAAGLILDIKKATNLQDYTKLNDFFGKIWKEEFELDRFNRIDDYKNGINYFIEESSNIVSAIHLSENKEGIPYIGRFATNKKERGKGLGTKLIKHIIDNLHSKGEKELIVFSEINKINYYEKFGFKKIGEPKESGNTQSVKMILKMKNNEK